jgi:hypothetical protein
MKLSEEELRKLNLMIQQGFNAMSVFERTGRREGFVAVNDQIDEFEKQRIKKNKGLEVHWLGSGEGGYTEFGIRRIRSWWLI